MTPGRAHLVEAVPAQAAQGDEFAFGGVVYALQSHPLGGQLTLSSCINQTQLQADNHEILFSAVTVILMIVLIAVFVLSLLTHYITTPIRRFTEKINRIVMNDYSFDPELEKPRSEMGEIGARLNELGLGFQQLLSETIALHDERAKIEMDLLQSQVNPHFLYNTLNSVHWMAVVQKNTGIEKMVKSLVNLLRNISKGVSDKIPLEEELALLDDYVSIQSIRYMGAFQYVCSVPQELRRCKVIKFTLQPLVENAIFHGVVPKGSFGTITVDAFEEGEMLVLTITDDGVGMTEEQACAQRCPELVFIMLTNHQDFHMAQQSLRNRAVDYLLKIDLDEEKLAHSLRLAIDECEKRRRLCAPSLPQREGTLAEAAARHAAALLSPEGGYGAERAIAALEGLGAGSRCAAALLLLDPSAIPDIGSFTREERQRLFRFHLNLSLDVAQKVFQDTGFTLLPPEPGSGMAVFFLMLGYDNAYYFTKVFKRYMNMTPTEYQAGSARE